MREKLGPQSRVHFRLTLLMQTLVLHDTLIMSVSLYGDGHARQNMRMSYLLMHACSAEGGCVAVGFLQVGQGLFVKLHGVSGEPAF